MVRWCEKESANLGWIGLERGEILHQAAARRVSTHDDCLAPFVCVNKRAPALLRVCETKFNEPGIANNYISRIREIGKDFFTYYSFYRPSHTGRSENNIQS